jgi:hypothetical protein
MFYFAVSELNIESKDFFNLSVSEFNAYLLRSIKNNLSKWEHTSHIMYASAQPHTSKKLNPEMFNPTIKRKANFDTFFMQAKAIENAK